MVYRERRRQPNNAPKWWTMAAAVATVLIAQAHTIPEPWGHAMTLIGLAVTAAAGIAVQPRRR